MELGIVNGVCSFVLFFFLAIHLMSTEVLCNFCLLVGCIYSNVSLNCYTAGFGSYAYYKAVILSLLFFFSFLNHSKKTLTYYILTL